MARHNDRYAEGGGGGEGEGMTADQKFLTSSQFSNRAKEERVSKPVPLGGGKRFEMWVSLKVGLADAPAEAEGGGGEGGRQRSSRMSQADAAAPEEVLPAFAGYQARARYSRDEAEMQPRCSRDAAAEGLLALRGDRSSRRARAS